MDSFTFQLLETAFYILFGVGGAVGAVWAGYKRKRRPVDIPHTSVLLSYYTDGSNLMAAARSKIGSMHYNAVVIHNSQELGAVQSALLYRVELPFFTSIHLLGIPKLSGTDKLNPATGSSLMEPVELEGNYSQYFSLYAEKEMQSESRYVLDPKAMVFTIDFCQSHSWEIVGNELYFVQQSGTGVSDDNTSMFDDIQKFVDEIRPAIERELTDKQKKAISSYGSLMLDNVPCPICKKTLVPNEYVYACPDGDGYLLSGGELVRLRDGEIKLPSVNKQVIDRHSPLVCPMCQHKMSHVPYSHSRLIIDSCSNCPFRWLDAGELSKS